MFSVGTEHAAYDDAVCQAREEINRYSEAAILERSETATTWVKTEDDLMLMGVIKPAGDYDEKSPLVMPLPFGNGLSPHMVLRGMMLQKSVGEGNRPLIMLPNNRAGAFSAYHLSDVGMRHMAEDRTFAPLASRQAVALDKLVGPEAQYSIIGYSQGAAIAPLLARRLTTQTLVSADAPNTQPDRSPKQLKKDFMGQGIQPLLDMNRAILDAGIESLRVFHGVQESGRSSVRQAIGMVAAWRGARIPENKALHYAMSGDAHLHDVQTAMNENPAMHVVLARAAKSVIFAAADFEKMQAQLPAAQFALLEGYGHEAADNVTQFAQFGRTALAEELVA